MRTLWHDVVTIIGRAGAITAAIGVGITVGGMIWVAAPPPPETGTPIVPGFVLAMGITCTLLGLAYGYLDTRKQ